MYDFLKELVSSLLMPLPFFGALALLGFLLIAVKRVRVGLVISFTAFASLLLLAWSPVADSLIDRFESDYPAVVMPSFEGEVTIVVLGGGWQPNIDAMANSQLSESSLARLVEGVRLYYAVPNARLVVTGTSRKVEIDPMAWGYRDAAISLGVPSDNIVVLDKPTDTGLEAKAVKRWLLESGANPDNLILVTSASHISRAMMHFKSAGLTPLAAPTHFLAKRGVGAGFQYWVPSANNLKQSERAWYEFLGLLAVEFEHKI